MKLYRSPWTHIPDDEYVARLRRSVALWDRWRPWLFLMYLVLIAAATWLLTKAVRLLLALAQPGDAPLPLLGFIAGAVMGLAFGWMIHHALFGLVSTLRGFRSERMLLDHYRPHDAQQAEQDDLLESADQSGGFREHVA